MAQLHGPEELIVVEANFRNPSIAQNLGLTLDKTLSTILSERGNPERAIQRDSSFGVSVIPAAPVTDGTMIEPILENFGDLLTELRKKYRYILLDSPPAMPFIDASIISGSTDGVVIVVESNATRSEVLNDAIDRLKSGGAPILGVILNKREFHIPRWLYRLL
jgi:Mrp family chromosome partitioning ATPase